MNDSGWKRFSSEASRMMRLALANKITIDEASKFFEESNEITNEDLRQYIVRYIWEIDGFRGIYMEILQLLERGASQEQLIEYFEK